ncbi:MAG: glucosaminidase domain-containing protein [Chloroflexi bacterium]|nr:glucosaminidase domain-containing protein [Chloroflexota bacterium]
MPVASVAGRSAPTTSDPAPAQPDFVSARAAASTDATAAAQQVTPFAPSDVDSSSPEAFIRSVAPYAARVSKATGIPAAALIGMAANETGYGKYASHNNLFGIKGTGPAGSFSTPTQEDYGNGFVTITDNFRAYHSPAESFIDFANLIETSPRYKNAVGQTTVDGFVSALRQGGYMTDPNYVAKIDTITTRYSSVIDQSLQAAEAAPLNGQPVGGQAVDGQAVSGQAVGGQAVSGQVVSGQPVLVARTAAAAPPVAQPGAGVVVPDQFHSGLAPDEAMAACGPVAAIAFSQVYGRTPTPAEAMDLAKQSGWTAAGGMNGIANEKRLLDKMGLPSQLEIGANWDHIQADANQHEPVILSTPGHYFVIDGYDPKTGAYHVGQSGKVYRAGSDWMTAGQIEALGGMPSGALYTVHPQAAGGANGAPVASRADGSGNREVLPPLDLGNTPPPPPISAPAVAAPTPTVAMSASDSGSPTSSSVSTPSDSESRSTETISPITDEVPSFGDSKIPSTDTVSPSPDALSSAPVTVNTDPPTIVAVPVHDQPPPSLAISDLSASVAQPDVPPPSPGGADAASLVPPNDATLAQAQSADIARPGLPVNPALAIGAVAVGNNQRQPIAPPPPPRRRRPEDDEAHLPDA